MIKEKVNKKKIGKKLRMKKWSEKINGVKEMEVGGNINAAKKGGKMKPNTSFPASNKN